MRHASGSDGGTGGDEGNVHYGPWPQPAPRETKLAGDAPAAATNWMRDANAITDRLVDNQASQAPDEFFDQLPSTADTHADDDDLNAFITRQAATTPPPAAQTSIIDGTAALPSDLRLTKRQRRIHLRSISLPVLRAGVNRRKAHGKGERRWRTVITLKQALATFAAVIGVLAGISVVVSGALSGSNPERATLAGRRTSTAAAVRQSTVIHAPARRQTAPTKRDRAATTSRRVRAETHKSAHPHKHSTAPPTTSRSSQAVAYVQKPAATTPSIVEATSPTVSNEPTAANASADHATHTGPTGAGAPFAPGAQVK